MPINFQSALTSAFFIPIPFFCWLSKIFFFLHAHQGAQTLAFSRYKVLVLFLCGQNKAPSV